MRRSSFGRQLLLHNVQSLYWSFRVTEYRKCVCQSLIHLIFTLLKSIRVFYCQISAGVIFKYRQISQHMGIYQIQIDIPAQVLLEADKPPIKYIYLPCSLPWSVMWSPQSCMLYIDPSKNTCKCICLTCTIGASKVICL